MRLSDTKTGDEVLIKRVECENELKQRFYSFGIIKGAKVKIGTISLARNTIEINIENTAIAIRVSEAKTIEVENI
jgi:Fe2+ transport system protein FeoA